MKIRLLNLKNKIDLNFWNNFIEKHSIYFDVYYDHKYLDLYENENQSIVILFISEDESFWVNCFLKNKILNYDHLLKKNFYDIEIPYGYGGPITNSKNKSFIKNAEKFYVKWCQENDIICEFVRFHPLLNNKIYCKYLDKIHFDRENRYIEINYVKNDFSNFNPKVRNKIRKIAKFKIKFESLKNKNSINEFKKLYYESLDQLKANKFYYFNNDYFNKILTLILRNGFIITAKDEEKKLVGAAIFLYFKKYMHYHLSAISKKKNYPGLNNFILFKAYLIGKKRNIEKCNLGGGISGTISDNLLEFKKSMSNRSSKFYIGYKIYNKNIYNKIIHEFKTKDPGSYQKHYKKIMCYKYRENL